MSATDSPYSEEIPERQPYLRLLRWLNDASRLIVPRRCVVCGRRLLEGERDLCMICYENLPFTGLKGEAGNPVERMFWNDFPTGRASAFLHYRPHAPSGDLFRRLKYGNRPDIGKAFGYLMGQDLLRTGFFDTVHCIVPVPLAGSRLKERGYNQSEALAEGVGRACGLPVDNHSLLRTVANRSQTQFHGQERLDNVKGIFAAAPGHHLAGRHLLLIDDILTTGATLKACAAEALRAGAERISLLTMGLSGKMSDSLLGEEQAQADDVTF